MGEDLHQWEEGEIREVAGASDSKSSTFKGVDSVLWFDEDKSLWLTKHSKNYRRALRQMAFWEAAGVVGTPPKSSKLLIRGNSSGKEHVL